MAVDLKMNNNGLKGTLYSEIEDFLIQLGNPDVMQYSKARWRNKIKKFIKEKNRNDLLLDMKSYKKLSHEDSKNEIFERKGYFYTLNLEQTRVRDQA